MAREFTVDEARGLLPAVQEKAREFIALRADITEVAEAINIGHRSPLGGLPEVKAWEARVHEIIEWFRAQGWQVKGLTPLLLDFPTELDGEDVLLCWLEGEAELAWYHKPALGFGGRRPLP